MSKNTRVFCMSLVTLWQKGLINKNWLNLHVKTRIYKEEYERGVTGIKAFYDFSRIMNYNIIDHSFKSRSTKNRLRRNLYTRLLPPRLDCPPWCPRHPL